MGVYIPNMSKPKSCYNHCFEDFIANKEIGCPLNDYIESHQYKSKIHPDCPLIEIIRCGECKHKPIKYDPEGDDFGFNLVSPNGYDNLCPCLNTDDGFYSYMPDDNFFCAYGERRSDD